MKNENTLYHKRARDILGKPFTSIVSRYLGVSIAIGIVTGLMNYTPTKVGGFWEHEVVFRFLHVYSQYLTYGTSLFYHG